MSRTLRQCQRYSDVASCSTSFIKYHLNFHTSAISLLFNIDWGKCLQRLWIEHEIHVQFWGRAQTSQLRQVIIVPRFIGERRRWDNRSSSFDVDTFRYFFIKERHKQSFFELFPKLRHKERQRRYQ